MFASTWPWGGQGPTHLFHEVLIFQGLMEGPNRNGDWLGSEMLGKVSGSDTSGGLHGDDGLEL